MVSEEYQYWFRFGFSGFDRRNDGGGVVDEDVTNDGIDNGSTTDENVDFVFDIDDDTVGEDRWKTEGG